MNNELNGRRIRGVLALITFSAAFSTAGGLFAEGNPCIPPLKEGIRNHLKATTSITKYLHLKDYLKSEEFRTEARKGGWSAGLTIPIYGVPVSGNAASSHDDRTESDRKLEMLSETELFEAVAVAIEKSEPNTQFTKQYFDCVRDHFGKGWSYTSELIGRRAYINIRFMPISASDPMPVLEEDATIDNATDVFAPKKGERLDFATFVSAVPRDAAEPITVTLRTTKGPFVASYYPPPPSTPAPTASPKQRQFIKILGVRHADGTVGTYFGFKAEDLDAILGRKDWHNTLIDVSPDADGPTRVARVFRSKNGTAGNAHGRYEKGLKQGTWSEGGRVYVQPFMR